MPFLPLLLPMIVPPPGPGVERVFGDWAVTCDNVKRCEAVAISDAPQGDGSASDLVLTREPGAAGGLTIAFTPAATDPRLVTVAIDGRQVGAGYFRNEEVTLAGSEAEGLARAMAAGHVLTLHVGRKTLARYSLKGASAALRYTDAQQGRAGGITALVARGPKSAAAVPAAWQLPQIAAVRPPKGKPAMLGAAELRALAAQGDCEASLPEHMKPGFHRLDARTTMVLVPCGAGASDYSHLVFVLRNGRAEPAAFDWPTMTEAGEPLERSGPNVVIFDDWTDGQLASISRPRYPGGCGSTQRWVWDGERFRLTSLNRLGVCGRWAMWMTAYRAEVRWR
jgi:hypothetical protein